MLAGQEVIHRATFPEMEVDAQTVADQSRLQPRIALVAKAGLIGIDMASVDQIINIANHESPSSHLQNLDNAMRQAGLDQPFLECLEERESEPPRLATTVPIALMQLLEASKELQRLRHGTGARDGQGPALLIEPHRTPNLLPGVGAEPVEIGLATRPDGGQIDTP